jgi:Protein of unknown function (DUF3383)
MAATIITPAVSASTYVTVNPSVLAAGGIGVLLNGVILSNNPRIPTGVVLSIPNDGGVTLDNYFGVNAQETILGDIYFLGFSISTIKPSQLLMMRYCWEQPVNAWLRSGQISGLTLAQLQAYSGQLSITIDGVLKSASISLAGATSFSNAAEIIQSGLGIEGTPIGSYQGSIVGGTLTVTAVNNGPQLASYIGSIAGTTLTVSTLNSGVISVGDLVTGSGISALQTITGLGSGTGGDGTYTVAISQTAASQQIIDYAAGGALGVGSVLSGTGIVANTYITGFLSGTGGAGTYGVSTLQNAGAEAISAYNPAVIYDSVQGAFFVYSGSTGVNSTISFASGALAVSLLMTQATGAQLSQGAAQSTPAGAMAALTAITINWASFMTTFEPVDSDKIAFAAWNNTTNNRFHYAMWDTNVLNTGPNGPSQAWNTINENDYSGTSLIHENPNIDTVGGELAAFVMGYGASINFNAIQGRATAAFKSQPGLAPQVFSTSIRDYIIGYGGNCYVAETTAQEQDNFYDNGQVSGPFLWLDSYLDQIWLNAQLQRALMTLLLSVNSIPYNQAGYTMIAETMQGPIQQAVTAGVIQPGVPLSSFQQVAVLNATGGNPQVLNTLQTTGWYISITPASAAVRAARQSPTILFYYCDGQSVQTLVLASIEIQ